MSVVQTRRQASPTTQTAAPSRSSTADRKRPDAIRSRRTAPNCEPTPSTEGGRGRRRAVQPDVPLRQRRGEGDGRHAGRGPGRHPPRAARAARTRARGACGCGPRCCPDPGPGPGPASVGARPPRPKPWPPHRRPRGRRRGRSASSGACSEAAPRRRATAVGELSGYEAHRRGPGPGGGDRNSRRASGRGARARRATATLLRERPSSTSTDVPSDSPRSPGERRSRPAPGRRRRGRGRYRRWRPHRHQQRLGPVRHGDVGARAHLRPQSGAHRLQLDLHVEPLVVEGPVGRGAGQCPDRVTVPRNGSAGKASTWIVAGRPTRTRRTSDSLTEVSSSMRSTSGIVSSPWLAVTRSPNPDLAPRVRAEQLFVHHEAGPAGVDAAALDRHLERVGADARLGHPGAGLLDLRRLLRPLQPGALQLARPSEADEHLHALPRERRALLPRRPGRRRSCAVRRA